jgi:hypothetical protein
MKGKHSRFITNILSCTFSLCVPLCSSPLFSPLDNTPPLPFTMGLNFFEIVTLEPNEGVSLDNEAVVKDLQSMLDLIVYGKAGEGVIDFKLRKSTDPAHPKRYLFIGAFKNVAAHDEFDLNGTVPKLLKVLLAYLHPVAPYLTHIDSTKVDLEAPVLGADFYHVAPDHKSDFEKEIEARKGLVGGWIVKKHIPPLPTAGLPSDPIELQIVQGQQAATKADADQPTADVWISLYSGSSRSQNADFGTAVKDFVFEVVSEEFEKFLSAVRVA